MLDAELLQLRLVFPKPCDGFLALHADQIPQLVWACSTAITGMLIIWSIEINYTNTHLSSLSPQQPRRHHYAHPAQPPRLNVPRNLRHPVPQPAAALPRHTGKPRGAR